MGFQSLVNQLDLGRIRSAIDASTPGLLVFDKEDARDVVWSSLEYFIERDMKRWAGAWEVEQPVNDGTFKATYDLATPDTIVDWKVIDGDLDDRKRARYLRSWQPRVYLSMAKSKTFEFRFLSRKPGEKIQVERLRWKDEWYAALESAENWVRRLPATSVPWLQNFASCDGWGGRCAFYADCHTKPEGPPKGEDLIYQINKTLLDTLGDCPEKARRGLLNKDGSNGSSAMKFGTAVHAGLAEAYRQLRYEAGSADNSHATLQQVQQENVR